MKTINKKLFKISIFVIVLSSIYIYCDGMYLGLYLLLLYLYLFYSIIEKKY